MALRNRGGRERGGGDMVPRRHYTAREYVQMLLTYGEVGQNARAAALLYAERNRNRRHPGPNVFIQLVNRGNEDGNLIPRLHRGQGHGIVGRPDNDANGRDEQRVIDYVLNDPETSIRRMMEALGLSYNFIQRVLRREQLHAFHYRRVQGLRAQDYPARLAFCQDMLHRIAADPTLLERILFTDESTFGRDGTFNCHNNHHYGVENPHVIIQNRHQTRFATNKWVGIVGNVIIGPIQFPQLLNSDFYSGFIQNTLPNLLRNVGVEEQEIVFQQDGAPAHNAIVTLDILDRRYANRWIGTRRPGRQQLMAWPPRSPDLSPLDFFYWGAIKARIYRHEVNNLPEMERRIAAAAATITVEMLQNVSRNFIRRLRLCVEQGGGHIEQLV
uniref:DUF4817 domain-containing protein n=1 Tax=Trichogramma kaykai TaxID=54128 RepID=A0ABD2WYJ0_9HYME